jgi:uncharacterized OB-fold protein
VPTELHPDIEYQAHLDAGSFKLLRARDTGQVFFYPRVAAPRTGSRDLEWIDASGRGTIYALTIVSQRPPTPGYNVVLVDLEEGPRVMSRVEDVANEDLAIGMAVKARVDQIDGKGLLVFVLASGEDQS